MASAAALIGTPSSLAHATLVGRSEDSASRLPLGHDRQFLSTRARQGLRLKGSTCGLGLGSRRAVLGRTKEVFDPSHVLSRLKTTKAVFDPNQLQTSSKELQGPSQTSLTDDKSVSPGGSDESTRPEDQPPVEIGPGIPVKIGRDVLSAGLLSAVAAAVALTLPLLLCQAASAEPATLTKKSGGKKKGAKGASKQKSSATPAGNPSTTQGTVTKATAAEAAEPVTASAAPPAQSEPAASPEPAALIPTPMPTPNPTPPSLPTPLAAVAASADSAAASAESASPETLKATGAAAAAPAGTGVAAAPGPVQSDAAPAVTAAAAAAPAPVQRAEAAPTTESAPATEKAASAAGAPSSQSEPKKKESKQEGFISIQERHDWVKDMPIVFETIPYTSVLDLKRQNNLKHVIKLPEAVLQAQPERALVVLGDERVVRVVLPPLERDPRFWQAWGDTGIDDLVMDAFSPPTAPAELRSWAPSWNFLDGLKGLWVGGGGEKEKAGAKGKKKEASGKARKEKEKGKKTQSASEKAQAAAQERVRRLEEAQRAAERERRESALQLRKEKEERARAEREERRRWEKEVKEARRKEEKGRKEAVAEQKRKTHLATQGAEDDKWSTFYAQAAQNEGVRFLMGVGFFFVFYFVVILGIKKRRKDYEDRVKLQRAAEDERKKLEDWEDEIQELEAKEAEEEERARAKKEAALLLARAGKKEGDVSGDVSEEQAELAREMKELAARQKEEEKSESMKAAMRFMRSGARVKRATRGKRTRRPTYLDLGDEVRFDDVAGLGEIRRELEEIVDFFQAADKYRRRGSKIPTGILLCGDPGCGKTLLAKAVAGEAGVNFFSVSASQFVEIFVGVGASRVRALYNEAQENAPAVVFIDELDAVGRQRGLTEGSGGQERDATLNQLLTCLDGFEGRGDVITIAATNRPDILDAALVRPGRFDRKIFIPKPSLRGRAQILQVHSRNKNMAYDVDYDVVAEITDGMSGAELANVVDVAALKVLREGRTEITTDDLLEAAVLEEGGYPNAHPLSLKRQRQLALNEASQAVAAYNFPEFRNMQLVTATPPMTEEKGEIRFKMDPVKFKSHMLPVSTLRNYVTVQLAPMVADKMWNPPEEWSTIWADHVDAARKMARQLAINGLTRASEEGLMYGWSVSMVKDMNAAEGIDQEATKILEECQQKAEEILSRNKSFVNALVDKLYTEKTLQKDEIVVLAETYGSFDPEPARLVDALDEIKRLREAYSISR